MYKCLTIYNSDKNKSSSLTMLAVTCINSIVNDAILIKFIIADFELNIKKLTHSARCKKEKALLYILKFLQTPEPNT